MKALEAARSVFARHRWGILLGVLLFTYVLDTVMPSTLSAEVFSRLLYMAVFAGTLVAAKLPAWASRSGLAVVLILWPLVTMLSLTSGDALFDTLNSGVVALILVGSLGVAFAELWSDRAPTTDAIFGAIFGYFLMTLAFAMFYVQLERAQPGSFELPESGGGVSALIYFSLVTITTLGYGDVAPVSRVARVVAGLEAAAGVMYVAVFIAMLIGRRRR
jgi:hypothetical protein